MGRVVFNVAQTQYDLVKQAGRAQQWKLSHSDSDKWDVCWVDTPIEPDFLIRMKPYQKVNHFPGMQILARKDLLAQVFRTMQLKLPLLYDFCPRTWLLPRDFADLKRVCDGDTTFIVKPEAESQGRGIFLVQKLEEVPLGAHYVVQRYIEAPLLLEGLKFDLRLFVLVTGCDPLRVYLHSAGLARFATEPYEAPQTANLSTTCMHLTNYAINKESHKFLFNCDQRRDDVGHKRSLSAVFRQLTALGYDTDRLWQELCALVAKTLCSAQPQLANVYRRCQPLDPADSLCFELLGFDVLLDSSLRPWLLEVNSEPSLTADTPLDRLVKLQVLSDTLRLLEVSAEHRQVFNALIKDRSYQQLVRTKADSRTKRLLRQRQQQVLARAQPVLGAFQQLLPSDHYSQCLHTAHQLWLASRKPAPQELPKLKKRPLLRQPVKFLQRSVSQSPPIREGAFLKPLTLKLGPFGRKLVNDTCLY